MHPTTSSLPLAALVGRPNVGKSTLFNRLVGKRRAIVSEVAGTTRDRLEEIVEWEGRAFRLADLAGVEEVVNHQSSDVVKGAQAQVERTLQEASVIIWVVDSKIGLTRQDQIIGDRLRKTGKPILVAINKCDSPQHDERIYEFAAYPGTAQITLSALHGRGISDVLDAVLPFLPEHSEKPSNDRELRVAIVGRPNVGKSTLLNVLAGEERSVVGEVAGTTRDTVDTIIPASELFDNTFTQWDQVRIVDTAGIRRRGKIGKEIEHWSLLRTQDAVQDAHIVLFMIDANEGMVHQDMQIAQLVEQSGRAVILLVNKWDQVLDMKKGLLGSDEDEAAQDQFLLHLRQAAPFLYWIQVLFMSAKEQMNVHALGRLLIDAYRSWDLQVTQGELDLIAEELRRLPRLKNLQKLTLEHSKPPVFHVHVEGKELPHFSSIRYIDNELREYLKIGPTPIKIWAVPSIERTFKPKRG